MKRYEEAKDFWEEKSGIHLQTLGGSRLLDYDRIRHSPFKIFGDVGIFILGSTSLRIEGLEVI